MQKVELQAWSKVNIGFVESDLFYTNAKGKIVPKTVPMLRDEIEQIVQAKQNLLELAMDEHLNTFSSPKWTAKDVLDSLSFDRMLGMQLTPCNSRVPATYTSIIPQIGLRDTEFKVVVIPRPKIERIVRGFARVLHIV